LGSDLAVWFAMSEKTEKVVTRKLHPDVGIGHVHLKVADLDRALKFYRDVLGVLMKRDSGRWWRVAALGLWWVLLGSEQCLIIV
jgi:catechol-2,3-dioxygenase